MVNFLLILLFNCVIAVRLYTHGKVASAGNADSPRIASPIIWLLLADELAQRGNGALNVLDRVNRHGDTHTVSSCCTLGAQLLQVFCCFDFFGDPLSLCFGQWLEFMLKATNTGNAGAAVADVVDDFVGSSEDFAGRAVGIGILGIRLDYPEHWGHL